MEQHSIHGTPWIRQNSVDDRHIHTYRIQHAWVEAHRVLYSAEHPAIETSNLTKKIKFVCCTDWSLFRPDLPRKKGRKTETFLDNLIVVGGDDNTGGSYIEFLRVPYMSTTNKGVPSVGQEVW